MYTFDGRIRYSEIDTGRRATVEALIDYFQDCSAFQSEDLGIGLDYMAQHHVGWVINYWHILVYRRPFIGERVRTGTSPYGLKRFMGLRNFLMETQGGEKLAEADSVWTLIDMDTLHPTRILQEMTDRYTIYQPFDIPKTSRKIQIPESDGVICQPVEVQEYHLDTNHHMNNGQYMRIASGLLPEGRDIRELRIEYRRQAVLGDVIVPVRHTLGEDKELIVLGSGDSGENPYAVLEIRLEGKNER